MAINAASPFRTVPRIRLSRFREVLAGAGSTWAAEAEIIYRLIVSRGHDPAVWLAICGREHGFGTNQDSVLHRNDTNSWTNARSVRTPGMAHEIISDAVRGGPYVRYRSALDSVRDGLYRIDDVGYVYRQSGATTIAEVLRLWTESDAEGYIAYVVKMLNAWGGADGPYPGILPGLRDVRGELPSRGVPIPGAGPFRWLGLAEKRGLVVHYSGPPVRNRADTLAVLRAEARYHVDKDWSGMGEPTLRGDGLMYHVAIGDDGTRYLCRDLEAMLWHCGETEWNRRALSVHVPIGGDQRATPAQLAALREIAEGWREFTGEGRESVRGHQELSPTACPGTLMADFVQPYRALQGGSGHYFPETRQYVGGGFWDYWRGCGGLPIFGYPLTAEFPELCEDGQVRTVQYFERAVFEWHPEKAAPYQVLLRRLGAHALERRAAS